MFISKLDCLTCIVWCVIKCPEDRLGDPDAAPTTADGPPGKEGMGLAWLPEDTLLQLLPPLASAPTVQVH